MFRAALKVVRIIAAVVLIVFGFICGFIPVLQGWVFILAGLALLGIKPHDIKMKWLQLKERWWKRGQSASEPD